MKNPIKLSFAIFCVLFIAGCGGITNSVKTPGPANDLQQNTASPLTIKATVPEGWVVQEGSSTPVQYMKGTASFMAKTEYFSSSNLDDVAKEAISIFKEAFDNVQVQGDVEKTQIDGRDARRFVFTADVYGITMKFLYVYVQVNNETYAITIGDMADTFDALSADYEKILSGIKFE